MQFIIFAQLIGGLVVNHEWHTEPFFSSSLTRVTTEKQEPAIQKKKSRRVPKSSPADNSQKKILELEKELAQTRKMLEALKKDTTAQIRKAEIGKKPAAKKTMKVELKRDKDTTVRKSDVAEGKRDEIGLEIRVDDNGRVDVEVEGDSEMLPEQLEKLVQKVSQIRPNGSQQRMYRIRLQGDHERQDGSHVERHIEVRQMNDHPHPEDHSEARSSESRGTRERIEQLMHGAEVMERLEKPEFAHQLRREAEDIERHLGARMRGGNLDHSSSEMMERFHHLERHVDELSARVNHLAEQLHHVLESMKNQEAKNQQRVPEQRGPQQHGPQQRGPQQRGPEQRGPQQRGPQQRGPQQRGPQQRGPQQRGPQQRGPQQRGPEQRGPEQRGPQQRGPQQRGPQQRGPEQRGPEQRGPEQRGPEQRGPEQRGAQQRGPEQRGPERQNDK